MSIRAFTFPAPSREMCFLSALGNGMSYDEVFQPLQPSRLHTDGQIVSPVEVFCWVNLFTAQ